MKFSFFLTLFLSSLPFMVEAQNPYDAERNQRTADLVTAARSGSLFTTKGTVPRDTVPAGTFPAPSFEVPEETPLTQNWFVPADEAETEYAPESYDYDPGVRAPEQPQVLSLEDCRRIYGCDCNLPDEYDANLYRNVPPSSTCVSNLDTKVGATTSFYITRWVVQIATCHDDSKYSGSGYPEPYILLDNPSALLSAKQTAIDYFGLPDEISINPQDYDLVVRVFDSYPEADSEVARLRSEQNWDCWLKVYPVIYEDPLLSGGGQMYREVQPSW